MSPDFLESVRLPVPTCVDVLLQFARTAWDLCLLPDSGFSAHKKSAYRLFEQPAFEATFVQGLPPEVRVSATTILHAIVSALTELELCRVLPDGSFSLPLTILSPLQLARKLIGASQPDHQLRYFAMRNIRSRFRCMLSPELARVFRLLSEHLNNRIRTRTERAKEDRSHFTTVPTKLRAHYVNDFVPFFNSVLGPARLGDSAQSSYFDLFIECCRMVDYVQPDFETGFVIVQTQSIDPEFLLSKLFGFPTAIDGFDALFGGGGIMLVDAGPAGTIAPPPEHIRGRAILSIGRYATGKSLLSLQVAVEVARKGGVALFMPLEQSPEDCLYMLETMGSLPHDNSIDIALDPLTADAIFDNPQRGALIFLRTVKTSLDEFLDRFPREIHRMRKFPLRMIIVDPINAMLRSAGPQASHYRARMIEAFETAKSGATNVWLNAEENAEADVTIAYEENIADVVIRLSIENRHGFSQRYVQVAKSRLQREQPGKHPYVIRSGSGIVVFPSSIAFHERFRSRRLPPTDESTVFGLPSLDDILGPDPIGPGDIIVLQGPTGTLKTQVGLIFLLHAELKGKAFLSTRKGFVAAPRNVLVAARDSDAKLRRLLEQKYLRPYRTAFGQSNGTIEICALPSGFVQPGEILGRIEEEFVRARADQRSVDRIMVDNVAHWETSCPFLSEDHAFGETVVNLFRSYGATSLLACGTPAPSAESTLQKRVIESADCVIQFSRFEFRGSTRFALRVLKSRSMRHSRDTFELTLGERSLDISADGSLLRLTPTGTVQPVKVRLFLHSENEVQRAYNEETAEAVRSTLSSEVTLDSRARSYASSALSLGSSSAVDELHIIQLDEFQVPPSRYKSRTDPSLYRFRASKFDRTFWTDFLPRLNLPTMRDGAEFEAIPFLNNISVLAYREDLVPHGLDLQSWAALSKWCTSWTSPDPHAVFFDFPEVTAENYNCLFLEILLSLEPDQGEGGCDLRMLLESGKAQQAALMMRTLCRRSYLLKQQQRRQKKPSKDHVIDLNPNATVWRTWFSTITQMLSQMEPDIRYKIKLAPLPGNVTIAGEWYLAIPAFSAAPDVGLKVIKHLTSPEAELDRLKRGVGLPTRQSFYQSLSTGASNLSPHFEFDPKVLYRLVQKGFSRSSYPCYRQLSTVLASDLQTVIDLPTDAAAEKQVPAIMAGLTAKFELLRPATEMCSSCKARHGQLTAV